MRGTLAQTGNLAWTRDPAAICRGCGFLRLRNTLGVSAEEEERARGAVANQLRFRDANDRLRRIVPSFGFKAEDRAPFICECADPGCFETVMLSLEEYDHVRANPSWFVLVAGHEDQEAMCERVVEAERGYATVEKVGIAATGGDVFRAARHQH